MTVLARPFIRWVGGKRRLAPRILSMVPSSFGTYHEPFLGSGALYLKLAAKHKLENHSQLSDANPELINAFRCVRDCPEDVIRSLAVHVNRHSRSWFMTVRALDRMESFDTRSPEERAARFIYLTNASYNGNWRVNRAGQMTGTPSRGRIPRLLDADAIRSASQRLQDANIICEDFRTSLADANMHKGDLVFLDPPHLPEGAEQDHARYTAQRYTREHQQALEATISRLDERGVHVVLSVAWNGDLPERFPGFHIARVGRSRAGDEALICNTMRVRPPQSLGKS